MVLQESNNRTVKEGDKKPIIMNVTEGNMELKIQSFIGSMNEDIDIEKEAPGPLLYTSDEVLDAIEHLDETIENSKQRGDAFHETYIPYECENSSEKVFNMMQGK